MTKMQTLLGFKQIFLGVLFDSSFVPVLPIMSSPVVAGMWCLPASVSPTIQLNRAVHVIMIFQNKSERWVLFTVIKYVTKTL